MTSPQDYDRALLETGGAAAAVIRSKDRITSLFVERVRAMIEDAGQLTRPMTINRYLHSSRILRLHCPPTTADHSLQRTPTSHFNMAANAPS